MKCVLIAWLLLFSIQTWGFQDFKIRELKGKGPTYVPAIELSIDPAKLQRLERPLQAMVDKKRDTLVRINAVNFKEKLKDYFTENAYYLLVKSQKALNYLQDEYLYYARVSSYINDGFAVDFFGEQGAIEFQKAYEGKDRLYKLPDDKMLMLMFFGFSKSRTSIFKSEELEDKIVLYFHDGDRNIPGEIVEYPDMTYWELTKTDKPLEFFYCPYQPDKDVVKKPIPGTEKPRCELGRVIIFAKRISN